MPLTIYCPHCVEPILYSLKKPNTCPYCSKSLTTTETSTANKINEKLNKKPNLVKYKEMEEDINEEEVDSFELNGSFEVEQIDVTKDRGIKLEDLGRAPKSSVPVQRNKVKKRVNLKETLAAFSDEAGKNGRKVIEIEDKGSE